MSKEITATATKLLQLLEPAQDFAQEEGSSGHVNFIAAIRKMLRDGLECDASLKAYILCEISFEYNDEIYNSGENEGSHPSRLFLSKKAANAECRKMNLENFMETTPSQYCYDMEEICHSYEEANELSTKLWNEYCNSVDPLLSALKDKDVDTVQAGRYMVAVDNSRFSPVLSFFDLDLLNEKQGE